MTGEVIRRHEVRDRARRIAADPELGPEGNVRDGDRDVLDRAPKKNNKKKKKTDPDRSVSAPRRRWRVHIRARRWRRCPPRVHRNRAWVSGPVADAVDRGTGRTQRVVPDGLDVRERPRHVVDRGVVTDVDGPLEPIDSLAVDHAMRNQRAADNEGFRRDVGTRLTGGARDRDPDQPAVAYLVLPIAVEHTEVTQGLFTDATRVGLGREVLGPIGRCHRGGLTVSTQRA